MLLKIQLLFGAVRSAPVVLVDKSIVPERWLALNGSIYCFNISIDSKSNAN